jgi:hypothetical protein
MFMSTFNAHIKDCKAQLNTMVICTKINYELYICKKQRYGLTDQKTQCY